MRKFIVYLILSSGAFLVTGCPDESDEFDITFKIQNQTLESIYIMYDHQVKFNVANYPEPNDNYRIDSSETKSFETQSEWFEQGRILRIIICELSTFESNDWQTILQNELYEARYDLTRENLEAINFEIIYN